jgi:hypothetical protein
MVIVGVPVKFVPVTVTVMLVTTPEVRTVVSVTPEPPSPVIVTVGSFV